MLLLFCSTVYAGESPIIFIDGKQLVTENSPIIQNGGTLVPLRAIFEALNQHVIYDSSTRTIVSGVIELQIDNPVAVVGNKQVSIDVPPLIIEESTFVPLRFIAESLGKEVSYDSSKNRIDIITKKINENNESINSDINPAPPANLIAVPMSDVMIRLSWDQSPGATGYKIYKKDVKRGYIEIGTTEKLYFESAGLSPNSQYWYVVAATIDSKTSDNSNEVTAATLDPKNIETSFDRPAPLKEAFYLCRDDTKIKIRLDDILSRGNIINYFPSVDERYIIATFRVTGIIPKNQLPTISINDFEIIDKQGNKYDKENINSVEEVHGVYKVNDTDVDVVVDFLVRKDDSPRIVFDQGKSSEVWFSTLEPKNKKKIFRCCY
jgi:hypothetical protein